MEISITSGIGLGNGFENVSGNGSVIGLGNEWLIGAINAIQRQTMIDLECSKLSNTSNYAASFKSHYHPLNKWLFWATNGNQRELVMNLRSSKKIFYLQVVQHLKICLKPTIAN